MFLINRKRQWKKRKEFWKNGVKTVVMTVSLALFLRLGVNAAQKSLLQEGIANGVLRLHILADSDAPGDQEVKMKVRDRVLAWLSEQEEFRSRTEEPENTGHINAETAGSTENINTETAGSTENINTETADNTEHINPAAPEEKKKETTVDKKADMAVFLENHLDELVEEADRVLAEEGMAYRAQAELCSCYFPERTYGDCTFPAGWYDALRISLGEAKGKNWWCVLYPRLCFSDCLHAVVEEDQLKQLEDVLTVEEYEYLLAAPQEWRLAFRWL